MNQKYIINLIKVQDGYQLLNQEKKNVEFDNNLEKEI